MKTIKMSIESAREWYNTGEEHLKKLILENFTLEELFPKELVKSWEDSFKSGFLIESDSSKISNSLRCSKSGYNKCIFRTQKEAIAYGLAAAQLSQIVAEANGNWTADWNNTYQDKHCVICYENKLRRFKFNTSKNHFPMKSREIAEECLKKHEDLWKQFFMID